MSAHTEINRSTLTYALRIVGSERALAVRLQVSIDQVMNWLYGVEAVPTEVFLKVIDIVLESSDADIQRSKELRKRLKGFGPASSD